MTQVCDVAIVGAGPAGLSVATALCAAGRSTVVFEKGRAVDARERRNPGDLVTGVGGAGLFSDGKFSFFPSATELWRLEPRARVETAYSQFTALLSDAASNPYSLPLFPPEPSRVRTASAPRGITAKRYFSIKTDLEDRLRIVGRLQSELGRAIRTQASVEKIELGNGGLLSITYREGGVNKALICKALVLAGGRFSSISLPEIAPWIPLSYHRTEFGVRIETNAEEFFLEDSEVLDPKLLVNTGVPGVEWRTFCTCRNGEVLETDFDNLVSYSGRSDVDPTQFSNVGFNVRLMREDLIRRDAALAGEIVKLFDGKIGAFKVGIGDFMSGSASAYGGRMDQLLRSGLRALKIPARSRAIITGPCIEGVGYYPAIDRSLRVEGLPVWAAGDTAGNFRGLTAAFVSGTLCGLNVDGALDRI